MNRYYITVLLLLFTAVSVLQATNVKIEPLKESTYNDWEPTYDNPLTFLVSVTGVQSSGSISFSFTQVSSWPGVYMNKDSDIEIENSRPDLRFYTSDQSKDAYANVEKAREDKKLPEGLPTLPLGYTRNNYDPDDAKWVVADDGSTATFSWTSDAYLPQEGFTIKITVKSKDGGSFGILQATFNGNATINIPKDDNGNYIADKCDTDYGYTKPPLDNEKGPTGQPNTVENNTQIGDGLVDFEEYRGFEVNGIHIRLNPTRKDIFIYSPSHLGIGYASDLRKKIFDIHEILESETKNKKKDRTVNFNSLGTPIQFRAGENEPWRVMAKKAIWIEDDLSETVEIPGESHGDGTISIYTKYIENETLGLMTSTDRRGCPWTDAEDAENKYTAKALGHEIGHAIGLKHPWESGVGVNVNGNVVGRVPQPNPVIPNLDLATNAKGWIGLYAFDNQTSPIDEIKRRSKIFKAWSDLEKNAQTAGSNAGLLGGIEKKKEAIATYRKRPDYQAALKKRNYYWQAPDADPYGENNDTVFSLKRHNHISGKVTTSEGPFTYTYGTTIMDYDFFAHGPGNKLQGIYTPSPSDDDADAVYPSFHNWEYDLGVPAPRAGIVWTPRPNPVPVPCGGTPVEQPEQPPTTPSNSGSEESGSNQNTQPPTPTDLLLTSENGQVRLSWTPVSGTVTDYEYRYRESGGSWDDDNWISMILSDPDVLTDTEFLVLSLINGTTYEFELRAMNGEIASAATESSESTPATVPGEPTSLVGDRYNQGVTLRWYPPDDDGGADVTEYQYRYSYTYGTYRSWTTVRGQNNGPNSGPKRSVSIGGLTNGRQYQFQVRAKNSAGYGAESLTIYKTPATTPSAPQNLTAPVGDGEVSLDWEPPNSNGGLKITEYKYSYRESSSDSWDTEGSAGTEQEKTITGLTNGTEYEFRVRAKNRMGLGPWSDTLSATPQPPPVWSDIPDPYNLTVGDSFSLDLSIYVTGSPTITRTSGRIPAGLSLSNGVLSGTVTTVESRGLQFTATNSAGSAKSEWVQIDVTAASTPTVTAPVWSDIPDPYNLTVGDSFYLDLNSYVTGSPTFTRNARTDGGYPIGTSVSNGVISGTVTRVHSRGFRFKATNSAGSAYSEWIQVNVTARP